MFEWVKVKDELEFRAILAGNSWLRKFLISYCFDEGFIFFNKRKVSAAIGMGKNESLKDFKKKLITHIELKRKELVGVPMHLQSYQYFIHVIDNMRKSVRNHYDILIPYAVQLDKADVKYVVDVFLKNLKVSRMQKAVLKGGL